MMLQFAEALQKMTWSEMNRISTYIADDTNQRAHKGEEVDGVYVALMLVHMAEDIIKEHEQSAAEEAA